MGKYQRKAIAAFAAAVMLAGAAPMMPASAEVPLAEGLVANITFDEPGTGTGSFEAALGGTVVEYGNVSYAESYSEEAGKALYIEKNAAGSYLELAKGLLAGADSAAFSFWLKPESGWAYMTTPVTGAQEYLSEKYVGMLASSSALTSERYNNSGTRLSSISANGTYTDWCYVTAVYEPSGSKLYINGALAASDDAEVDTAALFTADASSWIGHGNWGSGEGFAGRIDDFKIYSKALSEDEIAALSETAVKRETEKMLSDMNRLDIDTQFYKDGEKVFQIRPGESVTVQTTVTNYCPSARTVSFGVSGGADSYTEDAALDIMETRVFTYEASQNADYSVYVEDKTEGKRFEAGYLPAAETVFPDASPEDSAETTEGVHDPTVFKDPVSGNYFVYSSHNLVFESADLINWVKHDYTKTVTVPESTRKFIEQNYTDTTVNETYWAPDVLYVPDSEYPYWVYVSVSCGLGGRNSVIGLLKCKSPGIWDGEYLDCGVVIASKETKDFNTNAIDANIYTDTDGKKYFIWGSFWKGVYATRLNDNGTIEGIDGTASGDGKDSSIQAVDAEKVLTNSGARLFATPSGVQGPEGPWMFYNSDTGYRYLVTSYGWLGTNYNIRIARTDMTMDEVLSGEDPHRRFLDQAGRQVGTAYAEQTDRSELWGYKMLGSYQLGDGITYLGNGHCSVIRDGDDWYLVEHCRKVADAVAYLQVRKMLWTEDGWPVVSPLVYAGEKEQKIPEKLLWGTWELSSVGHTIFADGVTDVGTGGTDVSKGGAERNVDLPVRSSEIILSSDGTIADNLGTWSFDGDHTVTLNFSADGNEEENEFYRCGDTMKLFVLTGYDKDKRESAIVMTGTDQNGTAQLAKKNNAVSQSTLNIPKFDTTPVSIAKSTGGNPVLGFDGEGKLTYAGDPAALADGGKVYLYAGHDVSAGNGYEMPEWLCYSSEDMESWKYEGVAMKADSVTWANDGVSAWASQAVKHNGKYYLYFCTWDKTSGGKQSIGVAVSDRPEGPFKDIGAPLIKGTLTEPQTSDWNDIDPTVWVETDENGEERRYLAWGNGKLYVCELNEDMVSVADTDGDGAVTMNGDIKEQTFENLPEGIGYTEAPWIYRQADGNGGYTGKYYLFAAFGWRERLGYAVSDSMYGPWEFGQIIFEPSATSNTHHPSVIDFAGKTYLVDHSGALPGGSGYRRSVCVHEIELDENGSVVPMEELSTGLGGYASVIRTRDGGYVGHEAFTNPYGDESYPIMRNVDVLDKADGHNTEWEIVKGKFEPENGNYVSIQAVNKAGLYIKSADNTAVLAQDDDGKQAKAMTFCTVKALDGSDGVSFESLTAPGKFLTASENGLTLSYPYDARKCSFDVNAAISISDADVSDGKLRFTAENSGGEAYGAAVQITEYDENGALCAVRLKQVSIAPGKNEISADCGLTEGKGSVTVIIRKGAAALTDIIQLK